jgi:prevent-host-death family protein
MPSSTNTVTAFDAKNRLGQLLDRVQAGEEWVITRHGRPIAKVVPVKDRADNDAREALKTFEEVRRSLAKSKTKFSRDEIKAWREEGRK